MPNAWKASALAVASQFPVIAVGWLWLNDRVPVRPLYAVLMAAGYEVFLLAVAFGKEVWQEELKPVARKATADWILGFVRGFKPGFRRRYKKMVLDEHGGFNVRGLGLINTYRLKLEQVFVELRIDPTNPQRFNRNLTATKQLAGNRPVWDFLRETEAGVRALAIIGPPGCGKTTLLRHVALTLAANRQRRQRVRAYVPVLLFLRDHTSAVAQTNPPSLGKLLEDYFGDGAAFAGLKRPAGWFEKQLRAGKCLVLLDGLDEVAEVSQRRAVSAWVDAQIKNYPRSRFVLTARPQGYTDAPLERADVVLEVQPFDAVQVWRFVENWYLANEAMSSGGRVDAGVRRRALDDARDLMRRLRAVPALSALTVNPLLLTMIAMVHRYRGKLPGSRVGLYDSICEVLLESWRQVRGVKDRYDLKADQKLVVLRPLAAHMMGRRLRDIPTGEVLSVITPLVERVGIRPEDAGDFLTNLQDTSGLMVEREAGLWSFAHLTFQEYLTAAHWLERSATDRDWRALVGEAWWHETLRLYAAQGDATPLVRACLEVETVPALSLAADFLEENRELDPELRRATNARLIDDLESDDPARRRLAAEVQLARRLKSLQQIDDRREIDLKFITCAEYQLFLDDVRAQGEHRQPDHWTDFKFPKGEALRPVSGMRAEDAVVFCAWLTRQQGGDSQYRLPQPDEARELPAETVTLGAWCQNENEFSLLGLSPEEAQKIRHQLAGLSDLPLPSPLHLAYDRAFTRDLALALPINLDLERALDLDRERALDLDRDLDRGIDRSLDRALARSLARDRDRDLAHTLDLAINLALALALDLERDRELARARARAISLSLHLARTLGRALDRDRTHARALDLSLDLDRALALDRTRALDRARDLVRAQVRDLSLARALARARQRARDLARAIEFDLDLALDRTLYRPREIPHKEIATAYRVVEGLIHSSSTFMRRRLMLINDLLLAATAPTYTIRRQWRRRYAAHILEFAYIGSTEAANSNTLSRWRRRLRIPGTANASAEERQQAILNLHWWLQIVMAREEGTLQAWEGIRVVREQVSEAGGARTRE